MCTTVGDVQILYAWNGLSGSFNTFVQVYHTKKVERPYLRIKIIVEDHINNLEPRWRITMSVFRSAYNPSYATLQRCACAYSLFLRAPITYNIKFTLAYG